MHFEIVTRTAEERNDPFLAWEMTDRRFFASGACHILAHTFLMLHHNEDFVLTRILPTAPGGGNHYFASDGERMFDFMGWSREVEYLPAMRQAMIEHVGAPWDFELIRYPGGLVEHIKSGDHRLRPPEYFPEPPWRRAHNYIRGMNGLTS